ncbi:MAG: M23 family metallopeptidase [Candidatus Berkelbacteria bacterium]|nr:M23 family metallopeptidase [Candidatus Berkelbacteria bacterium]
MDVVLPIDGSEIPDFQKWVNWNGFRPNHSGIDFAAYLNNRNELIIGLQEGLPVRAIADGEVQQVIDCYGPYGTTVDIFHGELNDSADSRYTHVVPCVEQGKKISKGEIIGTLYKDKKIGEQRLVHLHLALYNSWKIAQSRPFADPEIVFGAENFIECDSSGSPEPKLIGVETQPTKIIIANQNFGSETRVITPAWKTEN